jgi:hypothetical protein
MVQIIEDPRVKFSIENNADHLEHVFRRLSEIRESLRLTLSSPVHAL